jgi:oligogalacturonide transport system permease protein
MAKRRTKISHRNNKIAYALLAPWLLGSLLFVVYPIISIIYMSFNNVYNDSLGWNYDFLGFSNYIYAFTNPAFYQAALEFTMTISTYLPVIIISSLLIARLLITDIKGKSFFRVVFFIPVLLLSNNIMNMFADVTATSSLIMDSSDNFIISMVNSYSPFLSELLVNIFSDLISILWFTGIPIILFINALQRIDVSTYEAAKVDGATPWQTLWKITLPNMKSTAIVVSVFSIVQLGSFRLNPLFDLLEQSLGGTSANLGLSATYAFSYSLIVFLFIGIVVLLLREKNPKSNKMYRYSIAESRDEEGFDNE